MPDLPKHADAVLIPESRKSGARSAQRVASICDITDPLLGVDQSRGERSWIKRTSMFAADGSNYNFVSKSNDYGETYHQPTWHPKRGQLRHRWEPMPDDPDIRLGYLLDEGARKDATLVGV